MTVVYEDADVTVINGDSTTGILPHSSVALVVGSPPYNVGIAYDTHDDALPWPDYWQLVHRWCRDIKRVLVPGGRVFINVAPSVVQKGERGIHSGSTNKARQALLAGWTSALEGAGLTYIDTIAWCSIRAKGTAWGSWETPAAPNIRGDWEAIIVACNGDWARMRPEWINSGWKDPLGSWETLVSNVWTFTPEGDRRDHPVPYPPEIPHRAIRLSTWPGETVLDPWAGKGTTLLAARSLGRKAIGIEISARYCAEAVRRLDHVDLFSALERAPRTAPPAPLF